MWARVVMKQFGGAVLNQLRTKTAIYGCFSRFPWLVRQNQYSSVTDPRVVGLNPDSCHEPYTLTKEQELLITKGDPAKEAKFNELQLKLYLKREQGTLLPPAVKLGDFEIMLSIGNSQLTKFLSHLFKRHYQSLSQTEKKVQASKDFEVCKEQRALTVSEHPWLDYTLFHNCLFPRVFKGNISRTYDALALKHFEFGQKIILDCSFDSHMDELRLKHTAKQIMYCYTYNRQSRRPFSLHLCNLDPNSRIRHYLNSLNPEFGYDNAVSIHSGSYLDMFDKKSLVYLTPHTKTRIKYNPNDVYILGAIVDRLVGLPLTSKKAVKENIRHAALPLEQHLKWKKGAKSLCIHHCFSSLLDVKNTGDWATALQTHVPRRKVFGDHDPWTNSRQSR